MRKAKKNSNSLYFSMYNSEELKATAKTQQIVLKTPRQFLQEVKKTSIENVELDEEIKSSPESFDDNTFFDTYNTAYNDSLTTDTESEEELKDETEINEYKTNNIITTSFGEINANEIAHNPSICIDKTGDIVKRSVNLCYFKNNHVFRSNYAKNILPKPVEKPKRKGRKRVKIICSTCNKNVVKDLKSDGRPYRTCEKCKERKKNSYLKKQLKNEMKILNDDDDYKI